MGKLGGFLEIHREEKKIREISDRIKDFNEIDVPLNDEYIKTQAARCMDCGVPFCHWACPVDNHCPEWQDLVYNGEWKKALDLLLSTNPFPEFTGRICPALCEGSCTLGKNDKPVTTKNIELALIEKGWENGWVKPKTPKKRFDKKIAVIGSGPSGLAAAQTLNRFGYNVTVYEKSERAGGLLALGIPDFKLDKKIIDRRVKLMEEEGVKFIYNTEAGKDISNKELEKEFDIILMSCGSKQARDLNIKGREAKGVYLAMDFLTQQNRKVNNIPLYNEEIDVKDKNVLVIGGGDTGSDCVGTSVRQGAASVKQIEILNKPSETRTSKNPWPLFPMYLKTSTSHKEATEVYGNDPREWNVTTKEFIKDENGNLCGVKIAKVESFVNEDGRLGFREVEGSEEIMKVDFVFLAIGFLHPYFEGLLENSKVKLDGRGNVSANVIDFKTSAPKYFAAGDVRRGQSLVVWAISEGRNAAKAIHEHLRKNKN
ncbi:glutamate synthase subunit beta [Leptotrichia wadei]|uniref:Glutamate synthase subunit beta n=1 Tax=Leptotrichia wadei (strain F0279) TaxID=888055 RepID=U2PZT3_LEPWF|nr:glutamate synthase subunit beta [Leptotrichia wadei]ERK49596.1 glutamate synthase subunit beta [Leptotrichia wadei F0279]